MVRTVAATISRLTNNAAKNAHSSRSKNRTQTTTSPLPIPTRSKENVAVARLMYRYGATTAKQLHGSETTMNEAAIRCGSYCFAKLLDRTRVRGTRMRLPAIPPSMTNADFFKYVTKSCTARHATERSPLVGFDGAHHPTAVQVRLVSTKQAHLVL